MRRRIFSCPLQEFMVIKGPAARHVEQAAQDWMKWRRVYVAELPGWRAVFFVIF
jgi:hypothetical protein